MSDTPKDPPVRPENAPMVSAKPPQGQPNRAFSRSAAHGPRGPHGPHGSKDARVSRGGDQRGKAGSGTRPSSSSGPPGPKSGRRADSPSKPPEGTARGPDLRPPAERSAARTPDSDERRGRRRGKGPRSQPEMAQSPGPTHRPPKPSESSQPSRVSQPVLPTKPAFQAAAPPKPAAEDENDGIQEYVPTLKLELPPDLPFEVVAMVGVHFRPGGFLHEFACGKDTYRAGEFLLCETERGPRVGRVQVPSLLRPALKTRRRILRRATAEEAQPFGKTQAQEKEAWRFCKERLRQLKWSMKLLSVEISPGQRATFLFASEERFDFRDLVRDLGSHLRARIEMRQVGARDGAKIQGGVGTCGRELCCATFLPGFSPVSIRMAKDQGMVLNPGKLAGQCGRLKCCLLYEHETYKSLGQHLPKLGKRVQTPDGMGRVLDLDILRERVRVQVESIGAKTYAARDLTPVAPPAPAQPTAAAAKTQGDGKT